MKKFVQVFKVPLIVFAVILTIGISCKIIVDNRPPIEFERNNPQCTTERSEEHTSELRHTS